MEYLWIALVLAAVLPLAWYWHRKDVRAVHACLARQAEKRGGRLRPATWLTFPQLTLPLGEDALMISAMPGGAGQREVRPADTFAQVYLRGPFGLEFTIASRSLQTRFEAFLGARDLVTGNDAFDARFAARGAEPAWFERLLDRELQDRLLALDPEAGILVLLGRAPLYENGRLVPDVERPRLSVSIQRIATDDAAYDRLIDTAILLHGKLAAAIALAPA